MTGNGVKTWTGDEKRAVEVCRESAKMLDLQRFGVFGGLSDRRIGRANGPER